MSQAFATTVVNAYPSGVDNTQRHAILFGTISISASPATYVTGGLPLAFASTDTDSSGAPVWVEMLSATGANNAYKYQAPTLSPPVGAMLRIYVAGTELANGAAVPAGVSGDVIAFRAEFNRGI